VELITYTNQNCSVNFQPLQEKKKMEKNDNSSLLATSTKTTRKYKPVVLTYFKY
jgi:hypothetical protein